MPDELEGFPITLMVSPAAAPAVATPASVFFRSAKVSPELLSFPPVSSTNHVVLIVFACLFFD
jgi:hypothetical protein